MSVELAAVGELDRPLLCMMRYLVVYRRRIAKTSFAALLVSAGLVTPLAAQVPPARVLDLRPFDRAIRSTDDVIHCIGGSLTTHSPRQSLPLMITIEMLDGDAYPIAAPFEFRVRFRNVGTETLTLPWSGRQDVPCNQRHPLTLQLGLSLVTPAGELEPISGRALVGLVSDPASLLVLAPAEEAVSIVPGNWTTSRTALTDAMAAGRGIVRLRGRVLAEETNGVTYDRIVSDNEASVLLVWK